MAKAACFVKAIDNARPYKSHRYDVFGPKVRRMLTLFGSYQIDTWLLLESNPLVLSYCERPVVIHDAKPKLTVDFSVSYAERDELWLIDRDTGANFSLEKSFPIFLEWARQNNFDVRTMSKKDPSISKIYLENWGYIVRDLSANSRYLNSHLLNSVLEVLEEPRPIIAVCNLFPLEDPVLVRVAVYSLLHSGKASCPDIKDSPLGPTSVVGLL
ncbi:hypothetical protein [Undibacterium baiyunense]|uniref:TnsA endonuclease N terminal n=1 Tax=Undibacterium baiyunense TaxID=2828731 RepID=A0A941DBJ5_9BURK|nr:hypothetical protein [Undibacterium baiyunense]MBR7745225.1 hypothetical protein [Undibacterium baiyunense]